MAEVTQKICDGCGVAGKKGEPAYGMTVRVYRVENGAAAYGEMAEHEMDVHPDTKCLKAAYRKLIAGAEETLHQALGQPAAAAAN